MGLYTVDKMTFVRGILLPQPSDMDAMILGAGNTKFDHHGFDPFGMPVISCDEKPLDSPVFGIKWIDVIPKV